MSRFYLFRPLFIDPMLSWHALGFSLLLLIVFPRFLLISSICEFQVFIDPLCYSFCLAVFFLSSPILDLIPYHSRCLSSIVLITNSCLTFSLDNILLILFIFVSSTIFLKHFISTAFMWYS